MFTFLTFPDVHTTKCFDSYCHDKNTNLEIQHKVVGNKTQSANKAFVQIIKYIVSNGIKSADISFPIKFELKEMSEGCVIAKYFYSGTREKLSEPIELKIKGSDGYDKIITYRFRNIVKQINYDEYCDVDRDVDCDQINHDKYCDVDCDQINHDKYCDNNE